VIYITWGRERAARPLMDESTTALQTGAVRHTPAGIFPAFTLCLDCKQFACDSQLICRQVTCKMRLKRV
jgi:hypothetical protein